MKTFLSILFMMAVATVQAQNFNRPKIDSLLHYLHHQKKAMGSVAIAQNGRTVYTQSFGYLEVMTRHRANSETLYRIGSVSKTFTATIVMQLIDEGKLQLDTVLAQFFPDLPNADKITIEELLDHHSGLVNFTDSSDYPSWMQTPKTEQELLTLFKKNGTAFPPGEKYSYSNTNYVLLSFIAEHIEHKDFRKILKQHISIPLHAKRLRFDGQINPKNNEALSYTFGKKGWQPATQTDLSIAMGAGGIVSTAKELTAFYATLFTGNLVKPATLKNMTTMRDGYGLGLFKIPYRDKTAFGHTGSIDGFQAVAIYFPKEKTSVALLLNGSQVNPRSILMGILDIYFGYPYEFPVYSKLKNPERYTGTYTSPNFPLDLTIFSKDGELFGQATGQPSFPLTLKKENVFRYAPAGLKIEFFPKKKALKLMQGGMTYELTQKKTD